MHWLNHGGGGGGGWERKRKENIHHCSKSKLRDPWFNLECVDGAAHVGINVLPPWIFYPNPVNPVKIRRSPIFSVNVTNLKDCHFLTLQTLSFAIFHLQHFLGLVLLSKRERARAGIEPTAAAPSQSDCAGVSRSDNQRLSGLSNTWAVGLARRCRRRFDPRSRSFSLSSTSNFSSLSSTSKFSSLSSTSIVI